MYVPVSVVQPRDRAGEGYTESPAPLLLVAKNGVYSRNSRQFASAGM